MKSVKNFIADVKLSLLFTHVCPATRFCRCCAFQIGKICCQNCIVRNFQFRKFLPVNSYPLSFIPSARQNVNEIFLIKIALFCTVKSAGTASRSGAFYPISVAGCQPIPKRSQQKILDSS